MTALAKPLAEPLPRPPASSISGEITTGPLLTDLAAHSGKTLVFAYEGHDVQPGYHVTEVKAGRFEGLDCGANPEAWQETFIQLWDIPQEDERRFMPVGKFLAIMRKVTDRVTIDPDAKLTFEVSDGMGAIGLYRAETIEIGGDIVRVGLARRPASCKPRDRWLEQRRAAQTDACCGHPARAPSLTPAAKQPCCA
jgi:hypothetical protein